MRTCALARILTTFLTLAACSDAPQSAAPSVSLAQLNILHGLFCPPETDHCRLPDRMDLLFDFIVARGCPDLVTMEEPGRRRSS